MIEKKDISLLKEHDIIYFWPTDNIKILCKFKPVRIYPREIHRERKSGKLFTYSTTGRIVYLMGELSQFYISLEKVKEFAKEVVIPRINEEAEGMLEKLKKFLVSDDNKNKPDHLLYPSKFWAGRLHFSHSLIKPSAPYVPIKEALLQPASHSTVISEIKFGELEKYSSYNYSLNNEWSFSKSYSEAIMKWNYKVYNRIDFIYYLRDLHTNYLKNIGL